MDQSLIWIKARVEWLTSDSLQYQRASGRSANGFRNNACIILCLIAFSTNDCARADAQRKLAFEMSRTAHASGVALLARDDIT